MDVIDRLNISFYQLKYGVSNDNLTKIIFSVKTIISYFFLSKIVFLSKLQNHILIKFIKLHFRQKYETIFYAKTENILFASPHNGIFVKIVK